MRSAFACLLVLSTAVTAFTSLNDPLLPGNTNFPGSGAGYISEQALPVVNVKYRFPAVTTNFAVEEERDLAFHRRMTELAQELQADRHLMKRSFLEQRGPADGAMAALGRVKP